MLTSGHGQPPAQLPAGVAGFAGRRRHLAELDSMLAGMAARSTVSIAAIAGTAGVGKTALALHWAHRVADRFPDGQLHVNLRGFDPTGQTMTPAEAIRGFLDALEVPPGRIPESIDAQAALYRSLLAGRRMLVLLDNARDADQVRPLLPATATSLAIVTSRNQLTSLVASDGAHPLRLDLLSPTEARELLDRRLGADRVAAEFEAAEAIIAACARLPLALSIATARAQLTGFPLVSLAAELDAAECDATRLEGGRRLDMLDAGDAATQVRTAFSWSYTALTPPAARLFRLLGLHPGPDVSMAATASLAGTDLDETTRLLTELTRASLLTEPAPGRYACHDLLRVYARDLAAGHDHDDARDDANARLFDHYVHTAHRAALLLSPNNEPIPLPLDEPAAGTVPEHLPAIDAALEWLVRERPVLTGAVRHAAAAGFDARACQLAWSMAAFLGRRGHWHDLVDICQTALRCAARLECVPAQAASHRILAQTHAQVGRRTDAHIHLQHALDLYIQTHDDVGQAATYHSLACLWTQHGDPNRAMRYGQRSLGLALSAGNLHWEATAQNAIGWCHALLGEHAKAIECCERALTLHRQSADLWGLSDTLDSLGYAHHHLGSHDRAIDYYQQSLATARELGDRQIEAGTLNHLGDALLATGEVTPAREAWRQSLNILTELGLSNAAEILAKLRSISEPPDGRRREAPSA